MRGHPGRTESVVQPATEVVSTSVAGFAFWVGSSRTRWRRNGDREPTEHDRLVEATLVIHEAPGVRLCSNSGARFSRKYRCSGGTGGKGQSRLAHGRKRQTASAKPGR